jgi:beta-N-acetylhexosaminidase
MTAGVSQLFIWGFSGTQLSREAKIFLKKNRPAGVILFKRNIESRKQMVSLTRELRRFGGTNLLIGIDEEGGRVSRLPQDMMRFPRASFWGEVCERTRDLDDVTRFGSLLGKELRSVGVNLDFAPVLDVDSNPKNPIIGDRAFSSHPDAVSRVALAFEKGLRREGIITCGKHFPGHGDTDQDSHLTLPFVNRSRRLLESVELKPFQAAARAGVPMLMTAHVVYRALDSKNMATFSSKILKGLLREKLKFRGLVISDDFRMKAVSEKYSEVEAAVLGLNAGVDLPLVCEGMEESGEEILEELSKEIRKSEALHRTIEKSLARLSRLKF